MPNLLIQEPFSLPSRLLLPNHCMLETRCSSLSLQLSQHGNLGYSFKLSQRSHSKHRVKIHFLMHLRLILSMYVHFQCSLTYAWYNIIYCDCSNHTTILLKSNHSTKFNFVAKNNCYICDSMNVPMHIHHYNVIYSLAPMQ